MDDVLIVFPENAEILTSKKYFETIKKANPTAILKAWFSYVYMPYQSVIDEGNISFFFEKDYQSDLSIIANSGEIMQMIDRIRAPLREMSSENKQHTAKYVQVLSKLSAIYTNGSV
jgi:F420-dependent methylenetetrahydromethanopterin dehydrogenase